MNKVKYLNDSYRPNDKYKIVNFAALNNTKRIDYGLVYEKINRFDDGRGQQ